MMHRLVAVVALALLGTGLTASARVYLVAAGVADYPGTRNDLRLPAADARTVVWLYTKNGDVEYRLLTDSEATVARILSAVTSTFARAGAGDTVVFFFSGHGYPGGFVAYDAPFDYAKVRAAMAGSRAGRKMIFADACYAGRMGTPGKDNASSVAAARNADVMLFLASRAGETSIEKGTMQNGLFTTCLIKALRGGADADRDRVVTARELYDYVHRKVMKYSSGKQHPVMWGRFPDDMPVMRW